MSDNGICKQLFVSLEMNDIFTQEKSHKRFRVIESKCKRFYIQMTSLFCLKWFQSTKHHTKIYICKNITSKPELIFDEI